MRLAARIELTEQEQQKLLRLRSSRKTAVRLVERLDIILLAHEGKTNQVIAEQLGVSENKVGRWRNRYCEGGLKALEKDRPRGKNHAVQEHSWPNTVEEQSHQDDNAGKALSSNALDKPGFGRRIEYHAYFRAPGLEICWLKASSF